MGVQLLLVGAAESSTYDIPIAVRSSCRSIVIPAKLSALLCVLGGVSDTYM